MEKLADAVVQGDGMGGTDTREILWYPINQPKWQHL